MDNEEIEQKIYIFKLVNKKTMYDVNWNVIEVSNEFYLKKKKKTKIQFKKKNENVFMNEMTSSQSLYCEEFVRLNFVKHFWCPPILM